ncbi:MAG: hypothetical protein ACYDD1_05190 [Caulobacteraceae bacterium]
MPTTLKAVFDTRRDAEMTVERLVQEYGIERTDIYVAAEGDENSAGAKEASADAKLDDPSTSPHSDAALHGRIKVSIDFNDLARRDEIPAAFSEFGGRNISD